MNNKIDNLLKVYHAQFATAPIEEVKSISAALPGSQTYPPVKIKHPSKLFKYSSPRNQTTTGHSPSGLVHFVNTITVSSKLNPTNDSQSTLEGKANDEEVVKGEPNKPGTQSTTSEVPKEGDELKGEDEVPAKPLSSPSKDPREELKNDTVKTLEELEEELEDDT